MDNAPLRAGAFVVGGLFIGLWIFLGLFRTPMFDDLEIQAGLWWFWGFVGLAIAGGLLAGRVATPTVRIAIWIALGIAVGMLIGAAVFQAIAAAMAALFTMGGGAIIVTGLPGFSPQRTEEGSFVEEPEPPARRRIS